ncbi:hypothetical protein [Streptomyces antimicrobicus]|uniref:Uncharacterized protein n=1 Tax=Streptomyces antimicrobicus TaxID=2883108 RepID=A0ABS8BD04_9ACTN|nr:hypothetical protein [Streptomyces antimicrobicus]MCB5182524.1 hypothetical protein [Streptomyces antimicrobicus]
MSAAEREDVPRPSAVPPGPLSMQALLASCAAATAVSTPPRTPPRDDPPAPQEAEAA